MRSPHYFVKSLLGNLRRAVNHLGSSLTEVDLEGNQICDRCSGNRRS